MKQERAGFNGFLLSLIALITIVAVPLATLILMQMMFLPYHSLAITWWHRILVLADLVFLIVMWGMYSNQSGIERPPFLFRHWDRQRNGLALAANICLIAVALWLSFWEGRWAGEPYVGRAKLHARGVVWGLFPDRLILWNEIVVRRKPSRGYREGNRLPRQVGLRSSPQFRWPRLAGRGVGRRRPSRCSLGRCQRARC